MASVANRDKINLKPDKSKPETRKHAPATYQWLVDQQCQIPQTKWFSFMI